MRGPTSSICYRQHSSQVHMTTQAPPLRQSRDTFGGTTGKIVPYVAECKMVPLYSLQSSQKYLYRTGLF
jgi:hypothetical protein